LYSWIDVLPYNIRSYIYVILSCNSISGALGIM